MATPFAFETIDDGVDGAVHGELSLALDEAGNPRVAYAQVSGQIMLARRDGGVWTRESVPGGTALLNGNRVCLAIGPDGNPHLAFINSVEGLLFHAVKRDDNWTLSEVGTRLTQLHFGAIGGISGLALVVHPGQQIPELRDTPHFAYSDLGSLGVGYARLGSEPSPIIVEIEDSSGGTGTITHTFGFPSMVFDPETEEILIAYVGFVDEGGPTAVSVRRKKILDPQAGTVSPVTVFVESSTSINVSSPTSIARTGGIIAATCISYFDSANKTLAASFFEAEVPDPIIETIESGVNSSIPVALSAAANKGQFRVAYADANAIKLASRSRSGTWTVEVVDPVGGVLPSLAYDIFGRASVAYEQGGKLKYAHRSE
jgi:hypothetical protein